jgi:ABC-type lipoprotein release transport system permease subunit
VDPLLFQVSAWDPSTLGAVALLLVATALGASAIPALRATRVDPVRTLASD